MAGNRKLPSDADRNALREQWRKAFGRPPPKYMSTNFMQGVLGWEEQAKQRGGLSAKTKRSLRAIAKGKTVARAIPRNISPGTHLVREWNGRTYQVEVLEQGFQMDGRRYGSLTAIAKKITGVNWSGPRFFGLNRR